MTGGLLGHSDDAAEHDCERYNEEPHSLNSDNIKKTQIYDRDLAP